MPDYNKLSAVAQCLLRERLRGEGSVAELVERRQLDQVDVTMVLLDADLVDDVERLTGVAVAHYPAPEHTDPWHIDNWRTTNAHPRTGPAGTTVRQLVAHGITHELIDQLQASGELLLEPSFPQLERGETVEDRAEWLADWVARHPDPHDIDNWRVTFVGACPERPSYVRPGMTVAQVIMRGFTYALLDGAMRAGWLRIAPRASQSPA